MVSSMLGIALSKPEKLYKCLEPRNPNKATRCKYYQIPTMEEVVIRFRFKSTAFDAKDSLSRNLSTEPVEIGASLLQ